jgi:hypothetical protein
MGGATRRRRPCGSPRPQRPGWQPGAKEDRDEPVNGIEAQLQALAVPVLAVAAAAWQRDHDGAPPAHLAGWLCDLVPEARVMHRGWVE